MKYQFLIIDKHRVIYETHMTTREQARNRAKQYAEKSPGTKFYVLKYMDEITYCPVPNYLEKDLAIGIGID